jgi:hypothetical protein
MTEFAYIGVEPCRCCTAAVVDDPKHKKDVAEDVANFIRLGLTIERVPVEEARRRLAGRCPHGAEEEAT